MAMFRNSTPGASSFPKASPQPLPEAMVESPTNTTRSFHSAFSWAKEFAEGNNANPAQSDKTTCFIIKGCRRFISTLTETLQLIICEEDLFRTYSAQSID